VRGVSFQVFRGELFALLGMNGAGKTTTIEVLEGLQVPSAGRVMVLGMNPVRDRSAVRARTGVMLQSGGFTGALTVSETVQIWRSLNARPMATAEIVQLVGLDERVDVAVEQLSGGEKRRLELALAVLGRPELLFLDEPTTGMDPVSRRYTWDVVGKLREEGTTVLLTTHYLEEAEEFADQVAIMQAGQIVTIGSPEDVVGNLPGRISFAIPDGVPDLPDLPGAAATIDGARVTYRSGQVQTDLTRVLTWANAQHLVLHELSAGPATLEDVFLDIVDHNVDADRMRAEPRR
jgi:ABC-2 type transport system ATP-binding protein